MSFRRLGRVPTPPPNAERYTTVCQFCNVACGYDVYVWPAGEEGGLKPGEYGVSLLAPPGVVHAPLVDNSLHHPRH
jgi:hypothetical protein